MNLRQIQYFIAVAEDLNFSRAAKRLHVSQPPLSKSIQQLEAELEVQLSVRDHHSVRLTEAGKAYRDNVQAVFDILEQARLAAQAAQTGRAGELRVGFLSPLFYDVLPTLLLQYRQMYPEVQVNIVDMMPASQIEALNEGKLDVAFPGLYPKNPALLLASRSLRYDPWYVCVHSGHHLASRESISMGELRSEDFVFIQRLSSPAIHEAIFHLFDQTGYLPRVVQTAAQALSVLALVAAGVGLSVFPEAVSRFSSTGLVFIPLSDNFSSYEHSMVWNPSHVSPVLKSFLDFLAQIEE